MKESKLRNNNRGAEERRAIPTKIIRELSEKYKRTSQMDYCSRDAILLKLT
jgi:hypothetical protein